MRGVLAMVAIAGLSLSAAQAGTKYSCERGNTVRTVAVITDTATGRACEVQYEKTSMGAKPEVLWHADSDTAFCNNQAKALVDRLGQAGWSCATAIESAANTQPVPYSVAVEVPKVEGEVADAKPDRGAGVTAATPKPLDLQKLQLRPTIH